MITNHPASGVNDVIGSRCDPYTHLLLSGVGGGGLGSQVDDNDDDYDDGGEHKVTCCHSNLTARQALKDGLAEDDVHDVLNVFMCTGFTRDSQQYFTKPSPVEIGDYLEFIAETDLLVSASTCPQGDVSTACAGGGKPVYYIIVPIIPKSTGERSPSREFNGVG